MAKGSIDLGYFTYCFVQVFTNKISWKSHLFSMPHIFQASCLWEMRLPLHESAVRVEGQKDKSDLKAALPSGLKPPKSYISKPHSCQHVQWDQQLVNQSVVPRDYRVDKLHCNYSCCHLFPLRITAQHLQSLRMESGLVVRIGD